MLPIHRLNDWSPFHLDALGLVTLLGAEEVSTAIGALEHSRYTECLPLFGTHLIAANKFSRPIPGFALYNVSDGVYIPILNGWFARWLIANLTDKITLLKCEPRLKKRSIVAKEISAAVIGFITNGALIVISVLQGDYYGLANAIAMAISVIVRLAMVHENRSHLNQLVDRYFKKIQSSESSAAAVEKARAWVKIIITAPEDKVIALKMRRGLMGCIISDLDVVEKKIEGLANLELDQRHFAWESDDDDDSDTETDLEFGQKAKSNQLSKTISSSGLQASSLQGNKAADPATPITTTGPTAGLLANAPNEGPKIAKVLLNNKNTSHSLSYTIARCVGWVTFAIHVICIGQSSLLDQMLSVCLLVCSTLMTIYNFGNDDVVGNRLVIRKVAALDTHKDAYLALQPTEEEQHVLRHYFRLPFKPNERKAMGDWNDEWWAEWNKRFSD